MVVAIVSQNYLVLAFMGYRSIIEARHNPEPRSEV